MRRLIEWIWDRGIVSTFVTGLFVVLPLAITIGIMTWVAGWLQGILGPDSFLGQLLLHVGLRFATNEIVASLIGWLFVLSSIWLLGVLLKATARFKVEEAYHRVLNQLPILRTVYGPVSQAVSLIQGKQPGEIKNMSVVYCQFGDVHAGGFLGLLASTIPYRFGAEDCYLVYMPTSPIPMTGGLVFMPTRLVRHVDMKVDELLQVYFSLGILSQNVVPTSYRASPLPA